MNMNYNTLLAFKKALYIEYIALAIHPFLGWTVEYVFFAGSAGMTLASIGRHLHLPLLLFRGQ